MLLIFYSYLFVYFWKFLKEKIHRKVIKVKFHFAKDIFRELRRKYHFESYRFKDKFHSKSVVSFRNIFTQSSKKLSELNSRQFKNT